MTDGGFRPRTPLPARFLSNGRLVSLVTARGTGYLAMGDAALTRWTADPLEDRHGFGWWLRDRASNVTFGFGPRLGTARGAVRASETPGSITLEQEVDGLALAMTCWVDPRWDVEWRRLTVTNLGGSAREVDLTGYAEVVLQSAAADAAHPVFSKLFVQTEWVEASGALVARRRPRDARAAHPWVAFALDGPGAPEHETDRVRFHGRGARTPRAFASAAPLSGTTGNVLDPVLAMRRVVALPAGESRAWHSRLAAGESRDEALAGLTREAAAALAERSCAAADRAAATLRAEAGLGDAEARAAHDLFAALAYRDPHLRPSAARRAGAGPREDTLRAAGVDGRGWLRVIDASRAPEDLAGARRSHDYARALGLPLETLVLADAPPDDTDEGREGFAVRSAATLGPERLAHLLAIAHGECRAGAPATPAPQAADPASTRADEAPAAARSGALDPEPSGEPLHLFNGTGGFSADGEEYVIRFERDADGALVLPPQPWTNVIANPEFGCLVSETGAGFTWSGNSREHRLTPWFNDPLLDPHGEALYVRDEFDGRVWSPQPGPAPAAAPAIYEARHRAGSSTWTLDTGDLAHRTTVFVDPGARVRVARVEITNRGATARRLRCVSFQRLVLGAAPESARPVARCELALGAVLASNPFSPDFASRVAWAAAVAPEDAATSIGNDRAAFLGAEGDVARPVRLAWDASCAAEPLAADPAAILEAVFEVPPGETRACAFLLGEEAGEAEVSARLESLRRPGALDERLAAAHAQWDAIRSRVRVHTPEPAIDLMVNGWLTYQNLSCRVWGRSALYQSGGAFGFRDQLQDAAALVWVDPALCREQIRLHARHQFEEGDVLHWWHPPRSLGIRTRFADDLLWLPLLASFYAAVTGDDAVLDEVEPFVHAAPLDEGEDEVFLEPRPSAERASVYEHAARAIDRSLAVGPHGLPLFGSGDWNDGMNRVGAGGRGESVWMAFFLHAVITAFAPFADARGERERVARWRGHQQQLVFALESEGWDGGWYRRGYYDDGTPLGSAGSDECRIDALVQAWSVLTGAASPERAEQAMRAAEEHLVSPADRLVRLLAPPFEHTPHDPGYIRGYVPGVRENGGQYTHAALWVVQAMAALGWRDRAAATLAMLSPVSHALDPASVARYQVEPYVIAADVYGAPPHVGRGGWTWYTGSAGWMFRAAIESIFGLRIEHGTRLTVRPCVPDAWREATLDWRIPGSETQLRVRCWNPGGRAGAVVAAVLDGVPVPVEDGAAALRLPRDGAAHELVLTLG